MANGLIIAIGSAIIALIFSGIWIRGIYIQSTGNQRMQEIATAIQEGASAYLKRQYMTIGVVGLVLFFALWIDRRLYWASWPFGWWIFFQG